MPSSFRWFRPADSAQLQAAVAEKSRPAPLMAGCRSAQRPNHLSTRCHIPRRFRLRRSPALGANRQPGSKEMTYVGRLPRRTSSRVGLFVASAACCCCRRDDPPSGAGGGEEATVFILSRTRLVFVAHECRGFLRDSGRTSRGERLPGRSSGRPSACQSRIKGHPRGWIARALSRSTRAPPGPMYVRRRSFVPAPSLRGDRRKQRSQEKGAHPAWSSRPGSRVNLLDGRHVSPPLRPH